MSKKERICRRSTLILCQIFTLFTITLVLYRGQYPRLPMAIGTVFLLLLPGVCEKLFHFRLRLGFYLLSLCYALGPMIGQCHNLYYLLSWWDKLLHALGGVMFALVGLYLFRRFADSTGNKVMMAAIFALCFSMAISMSWEFCEFASDRFFGTDMQQDTLLSGFNSYLLGSETGVTGSIDNISQVLVNGQQLPGYIDVGLHDTMTDMLWETLGALAVAIFHICSKGKYRVVKASA